MTLGNRVAEIGASAFEGCNGLASVAIGGAVARIATNAFRSCTGLAEVALPDSVTAIEQGAFYGCTNLVSVSLGKHLADIGREAFYGCVRLASVSIPASLERVGNLAFYGCSGLEAVYIDDLAAWCGISFEGTSHAGYWANPLYYAGRLFLQGREVAGDLAIPDGAPRIADAAFYSCTNLTGVAIPGSVTEIGEYAFSKCTNLASVAIPGGVTNIGLCAFDECRSLTGVVIPHGVTDIRYGTFYRCLSLSEVAIPDGVTHIGSYAFYACTNLTAVAVPGSVADIGNEAFFHCSALKSLGLPDGVESVGGDAFSGSGLEVLYVPEAWQGTDRLAAAGVPGGCRVVYGTWGEETAGGVTWRYCVSGGRAIVAGASPAKGALKVPSALGGHALECIGEAAFHSCRGLTGLALPAGLTTIGAQAFSGCSALTNATIPDGVANIGSNTFFNCSGLADVTIGSGVTNIGDHAFYGCTGLAEVAIPDGVASIERMAFSDCSNLTAVAIGTGVKEVGYHAFSGCGKLLAVEINDLAAWCRISYTNHWGNPLLNGYAARLYLHGEEVAGDLTIPAGVERIAAGAFCGCAHLESMTLPNSVTNVGLYAFDYSGLKTLHVPASWQGTDMLADASVPSGCTVLYDVVPATETSTGVPYAWLEENAASILAANGGDHEAAANAAAANGMPVWACYVAGLSPADAAAEFKVKSITLVDGEPVLEWSPDLDAARAYTVQGKAAMADAWGVPNASSRFFRVLVEMPE